MKKYLLEFDLVRIEKNGELVLTPNFKILELTISEKKSVEIKVLDAFEWDGDIPVRSRLMENQNQPYESWMTKVRITAQYARYFSQPTPLYTVINETATSVHLRSTADGYTCWVHREWVEKVN